MVIYKSQLEDSIVYQTLLKDSLFEKFMVYDNSPATFHFDESLLSENIIYVRDVDNGGVSKAYNTGTQFAKELGYSHVLLLDQDTEFPFGAAKHFYEGIGPDIICVPTLKMKNGHPFSPCVRKGIKTYAVDLPSGMYNLNDYNPVNSGLCLPIAIFSKAGGYNERVRLDFADFEFISRCRKVCGKLRVLPISAIQDFSNDETDQSKLMARYLLYLESAQSTCWERLKDRQILHIEVFLHTLALSRRTRSLEFFKKYFSNYLFNL